MTTMNEVDFNSPDVLALIEGDEELSKLPLGSDDLKAALSEKMSKTEEDSDDADAEENEDADSDDKSDEDDDKPKKPRGFMKRIDKLVTRNHALEAQIAELQSQMKLAGQKVIEDAVGDFQFDEPKPTLAEFDNIADYTEALTEWKLAQREAKAQHEAEKKQLMTQASQVADSWTQREAEAKKSFKDYSSVVHVDAVLEANPSQTAKEFLAESEVGPFVVYHLLSNEDLTEEFAKASAAKQVKILSMLEAQLTETDEPQGKTSTEKKTLKTPAPLPKGRPTATVMDPIRDADKMSDEEWDRAYEAHMAAKRKR